MTLKLLHQQGTQQGTFYWLEQVTCTRLKSMGRGHTLLPQKDSNGNGQGDIFIYRRGKKKLGPNHMIMGASLATQLVKVCFQCGRPGFDPWVGKIPWRGNAYLLQYSGLENSMDCIVHWVAKSPTQLSDFHFSQVVHPTCGQ